MPASERSSTERNDRRYISATMALPLLEREHEADLARRWLTKRDEAALHELVGAHARLVVRIAVGFRASGLPVADLIQEGNIGLMEAAERFDPGRDVRFSTYATWWIVASIQNYMLRNSSIVRAATTPKQRRLFFSLRRLRGKLGLGFSGALSTDERRMLADKLGVTVGDVERMETHLARPDRSLNNTVGEDDSAEMQDFLADPAPNPEENEDRASRRRARSLWIGKALERLTPREREIIVTRFLDDDRKTTLAEIGDGFGVSKERIRQIESRALQKMHAALSEMVERPQDLLDA
jgi:RNA polymerase sigma-32 factor